ncbi:MAG: fructosamine kinase family protein [Bacteroidota bacterium]
MPRSSDLLPRVEALLGHPVHEIHPLGGGCIARTSRVVTPAGLWVLKVGHGPVADTLAPEADGLRTLRQADTPLQIPAVVALDVAEEPALLLLEWIEPGPADAAFEEALGTGLAVLHRHTADRYGYQRSNRLGLSEQHNAWHDAWPAFFRTQRLEPQVAAARAAGRWVRAWDPLMDEGWRRLEAWLPATPEASLVHGDLWQGNAMATATGTAALLDPAVYYGHREVDLAMAALFGGFTDRLMEAYTATWPLDPGYAQRRHVYDLYHLINHLNLFGAGYAHAVEACLRRLVR